MTYNEREQLNHLIERLTDGELGFNAAAADVTSLSLKSTFLRYANQRADYAEALQLLVERAGEKAEYNGTLGATLHRGWINLQSALSKRDDLAILEECERGEDVAVGAYNTALASGLLDTTNAVVDEQSKHLLTAHNHIRMLRDSLRSVVAV